MSDEEFIEEAMPYFKEALGDMVVDYGKFPAILKQRTEKFTDIPEKIDFFRELPSYDKELFINKKSKTNLENAPVMLKAVYDELSALPTWESDKIHDALISLAQKLEMKDLETWDHDSIHDALIDLAGTLDVKNGTVMWPCRIAVAGKTVTPGGAVEILDILGKEESLRRMEIGLQKLNA